MATNENAAAKRAYLKAGGDLDKAADALSEQVKENPGEFPTITGSEEKMMREMFKKVSQQVVTDMPHLAGNPEGICNESIKRITADPKMVADFAAKWREH
jgi:hypothetical protein